MSTVTPGSARATAVDVFDVCGPLPQGTTVLEASAGTGKTFTIAALATRYVAEGLAELSELMLVTFGRMATSELRDRVRERFVVTERALRDASASASGDPLVAHLAGAGDAERTARRRRLTRALAQFDAATIATTHGFCQQMLTTLGVAGDVDPEAVLVPDIADLVEEVTTDLYLRRYSAEEKPAITVLEARELARAAVSDHDAALRPDDADPASVPGQRHAFALAVRRELARRKRARRLLDYDDLLTLLRDALTHPETGPAAAERVRSRYRVVMVDEFQDTDAVQWEILRTAFHGTRTLVLIGDPKQAIYAFRGADVRTYLVAKAEATATATLGRNWRTDEPVVRGVQALLGPTALGDPEIVVMPVEAQHQGRRLDGGAPVRVRQVTAAAVGHTGPKVPPVGAVRTLIYADVAADVVRALNTQRIREGAGWRPLMPGDIAVLARRNADASAVRDALAAAGVPAVESGVSSVFTTPAARHWLTLLVALSQPGSSGRVAAAALTPFLGWDAAGLAGAQEADRDALADRLRTWAQVLDQRGVAALVEAASAAGLTERLLRTTTGERMLTDVRHIGQALHAVALAERLGTAALTEWLRARIAEADEDYTDERSRRLETDAAAVQVITVHSSKGLEFPVVYVPFAWNTYLPQGPQILRLHDDDDTRLLHVGGQQHPSYRAAAARHRAEDLGEDLRLAYVALTRASMQVVTWWAPSRNTPSGALTRLLLGGHGQGEQPPEVVSVPNDAAVATALAALAERSDGTVAHEVVSRPPGPVRWVPPAAEPVPLEVGSFGRHLDATWRRTSYSGLTSAAHEAPTTHQASSTVEASVGSEPETTGIQDEPDTAAVRVLERIGASDARIGSRTRTEEDELRAVPSPMSDLPGGTAFGTLVHEVLEHVDTGVEDLAGELVRHCRQVASARGGVDADALAAALVPVMRTPLGDLAGDRTLAGVAPADRLAELTFELPLAGGDLPTGRGTTLRRVGDLLRRHLGPDDPFAGYADRLDNPLLATDGLRGYLTGSIDAVLRVRDGGAGAGPGGGGELSGEPRYLVVDYKTNRLAPVSEPVTAWHYRPAAMAAAMIDAHYPLQLLLYSVALHRYLRWRQPGYDPDRHLGGGLYLFVRGMVGPATPVVDGTPCGVMAWRPPTELVVELSALLDGRTS